METLSRVLDVAAVRYETCSWRDERFAAVNLLNDFSEARDQPVVSGDGDTVLFLDGEVYNQTDLWRDLGLPPGPGERSVASLCLALYQRYGDDFGRLLNGQFNVAIYRRSARSVTLINDRLAYRPLYYKATGGLFAFAVERKAVLAASESAPEIDRQAVLELFAFGHHLDDRTLFKGVQAMRQASVLTFDAGGARSRPYWRPRYDNRGPIGLDECAREFGRRLIQATALRAARPLRRGIFLSGGLDSRAVAGALARSTRDVAAFTFGGEDSADVRFARELAGRLGFRHRQIPYPPDAYVHGLPRVVWRIEGAVPYHQCCSIELHRHMAGEVQAVFNGHFGDALTGGHILPQQFLALDAGRMAEHILAKRSYMRLEQLRQIFSADFLRSQYPLMRDSVRSALASLEEDRPPLLYNLWDLTVRQRRFTFCSPAVDRYLFEQITPFVDNEVVDWCLRTPLRFLVGQRAYKRMIVNTFPEIADVPWARTSRPVPTSFVADVARQGGTFLRKRLGRQVRRAGSLLSRSKHHAAARPAPSPLTDLRLHHRAEQYLGGDGFLGDVFDRGQVADLLEGHFRGNQNRTYAVSALLTVAEGIRLFADGGPPESVPEETEPRLSAGVPAAAV